MGFAQIRKFFWGGEGYGEMEDGLGNKPPSFSLAPPPLRELTAFPQIPCGWIKV